MRVLARGHTFRGEPFTREQLLSAPIVRGGDNPKPPATNGQIDPACVIACLTRDAKVRRLFKEHEIDASTLGKCMKRCRGRRETFSDAECVLGCLTRDDEVRRAFEEFGIDGVRIEK